MRAFVVLLSVYCFISSNSSASGKTGSSNSRFRRHLESVINQCLLEKTRWDCACVNIVPQVEVDEDEDLDDIENGDIYVDRAIVKYVCQNWNRKLLRHASARDMCARFCGCRCSSSDNIFHCNQLCDKSSTCLLNETELSCSSAKSSLQSQPAVSSAHTGNFFYLYAAGVVSLLLMTLGVVRLYTWCRTADVLTPSQLLRRFRYHLQRLWTDDKKDTGELQTVVRNMRVMPSLAVPHVPNPPCVPRIVVQELLPLSSTSINMQSTDAEEFTCDNKNYLTVPS